MIINSSVNGVVSKDQPALEYQVKLEQPSNLVLTLDSLTANADLVLLDAKHQPMIMLNSDQVVSRNPGTLPEIINFEEFAIPIHPSVDSKLKAGTYYIQVALGEGSEKADFELTVSDAPDRVTFDLGELPDEPVVYRGGLTKKQDFKAYKFTVSKEQTYNFLVGSSDPEVELNVSLQPEKGKVINSMLLPNSPYKVSQIKEQTLEAGKYTLLIKLPKKTTAPVQFAVTSISKQKQDELVAKQEELRKRFEEQIAKAQQDQEQVPSPQSADSDKVEAVKPE